MKKRKLKESVKKVMMIIIVLIIGVTTCLVLHNYVFNNPHFANVKSVNKDAKQYKTKTCLAFYPDTKDGNKIVEDLCNKTNEEKVFDYAKVPYGDYYLIEYGNGIHYYLDKDNKPLQIKEINEEAKYILSDYLRYDMKKAEIDEAYSLAFLNETTADNLDTSECSFEVEGDSLNVHYPKYDFTSKIPLKYIQDYIGVDLGYQQVAYSKPIYVSRDRKTVAFTFDDGPSKDYSLQIQDALYNTDSRATFFVVGYSIKEDTIGLIEEGIRKGNQYGSHTQSHSYLTTLSKEEEYKEIMQPVIDVRDGYHVGSEHDFDGLGYTMTIYRAPYGEHKKKDETNAPFISIEWDCDSEDWKYRDKDKIIERVHNFERKNPDELDGCIILFHENSQETVDAIKELIPELIEKGYQLVSVDDILNILDIDRNKAYYPW